jgi:hypothetical protein
MCMWHNLKVLNLKQIANKYASYKNLFMNISKIQGDEISILMRQ